MLLTQENVIKLYRHHNESVEQFLLNISDSSGFDGDLNKKLALMYKIVLDTDPNAFIFNSAFSRSIAATTPQDRQKILTQTRTILPMYLTYKDCGYANFAQLGQEHDVVKAHLHIFKLLGNLRYKLHSDNMLSEDHADALFSAIIFHALAQCEKEAISEVELQNTIDYAAQIASIYLLPKGHDVLKSRRDEITTNWDVGDLEGAVLLELETTGMLSSLQSDHNITEDAHSRIVQQIMLEQQRKARIEQRRALLQQRKAEALDHASRNEAAAKANIAKVHADNIANLDNNLSSNIAAINKHTDDLVHDIKYCGAAGNMFGTGMMPALLSSGMNTTTVTVSFGNTGPDITASNTSRGMFGDQTRTWSYQQSARADTQMRMAQAQQIGGWWNTHVNSRSQSEYIDAMRVRIAPSTSSAAPSNDDGVNIINPYVASNLTVDPTKLKNEAELTKDISQELGMVREIIATSNKVAVRSKNLEDASEAQSLGSKILSTTINTLLTIVTGSSAAEASPMVVSSAASSALASGSAVAGTEFNSFSKFASGNFKKLGQEVGDVLDNAKLLTLMIINPAAAKNVYEILITPAHERNPEDFIFAGRGSGPNLKDTTLPPKTSTASKVKPNENHTGHSNSGPKPEEVSAPMITPAYDGERGQALFKHVKESGHAGYVKYTSHRGGSDLEKSAFDAVNSDEGLKGSIPIGHSVLYQKVGPNGEHLKFGISKNPNKRYTKEQLDGGRLKIIANGEREKMLSLERKLHEILPIGPEERQKFYVKKQVDKGLKPPPYER